MNRSKITAGVQRSCGLFITVLLVLTLAACAAVDPAKVDVEIKETAPQVKVTSYTRALSELGMMTEIFGTGPLKIQSNPIGDNTGTSSSTGGEIPRDITEMIKSSLNSIGGNVIFIPYDPAFIQNQMVTGYSSFDAKLIPDVVISGGITEFDRGLETRGQGTDAGAEADFTGMPGWLPSKTVALDYGESFKTGLARITLDFNLLDFRTMAGIARMNTVNSMEVSKAMGDKEIGITLFGPTFGRKGSVKKVQGRHAAVRLLVELSMIQIVGKHLVLPYWRLLGEDTQPDEVVMAALARSYYNMQPAERLIAVQEWLYLHGHDVPQSGRLDAATISAMQQFAPGFSAAAQITPELFIDIYTSIPINSKTLGRRYQLNRGYQVAQPVPVEPAAPLVIQQPAPAPVSAPAPAPAPTKAAAAPARKASAEPARQAAAAPAPAPAPAMAPAPAPATRAKIGRILSDEEW
ncbi:DUF4384 domain-containing protein [Desulfuromonas thiophila]|uniref:DUF4384 domain-containing protein n=1 Tax=Desulfuromonas thiophila TaxID=57664 RepID=A0A1G7B780_9BACT|nr:DUF4384 domain-containing protein [Desulfuromonas thiophila]SDE22881.1 hypothetical protein SAMN05661003_10596 [Desulfuromonas thiophila]